MNDLPALAAATVGVGVAGSRPGAVANWVDVILLHNNGAEAVPLLLDTAHRTRSIIRQVAFPAFALVQSARGQLPRFMKEQRLVLATV